MQRLTARFLLLFALAGTYFPMALAITAEPPHACCLRKSAHQCHGSNPDQRTISSMACCQQNCSRAVITSQWAHPRPSSPPLFGQAIEVLFAESRTANPAAQRLASQSTRAPPQASIA